MSDVKTIAIRRLDGLAGSLSTAREKDGDGD
jgi:hypothetical protein